jgi:hypothetical protein
LGSFESWGSDPVAAHHVKRAAELGLQTTLADWLYRWHVAEAQPASQERIM